MLVSISVEMFISLMLDRRKLLNLYEAGVDKVHETDVDMTKYEQDIRDILMAKNVKRSFTVNGDEICEVID